MTTNPITVQAPPAGRRFKPTLADVGGFQHEGVPVFAYQGDIVIALTPDRGQAVTAINAYLSTVCGIPDTPVTRATPGLRYGIGRFEREPDGSDLPWTLRLVHRADDFTVQLHRLPL